MSSIPAKFETILNNTDKARPLQIDCRTRYVHAHIAFAWGGMMLTQRT